MKKYFLFTTLMVILICAGCGSKSNGSGVSNQHSVDLTGIYQGTIPCADCDGIDVMLTLKEDKSFQIVEKYHDENQTVLNGSGTFKWKDNTTVELSYADNKNQLLKVAGEKLIMLDKDGKNTENEMLEENYVLAKLPAIAQYSGLYYGVIPCADCEGIQINVVLNKDNTFLINEFYMDKEQSFQRQGEVQWQDDKIIKLQDSDYTQLFEVYKDKLIMLNEEGQTSDNELLRDKYELSKVSVNFTNTRWVLIEMNGKKVEDNEAAFIVFDDEADENKVYGVLGCNSFFGKYTFKKDDKRLKISELGVTMMMCPENLMAIELEFSELIKKIESFDVEDNNLYFYNIDKDIIAVLSARKLNE